MVDVVDFATAIAQLDEDLDDGDDVLVGQRHRAFGTVAADARVELHAAHARQVVRVFAVEQAVEQRFDGVFGRRLAGAHHAVDGDTGGQLVGRLVGGQRLADVGALVEFVGEQDREFLHAGAAQLLQQRFGQLVIGLGDDLAGVGVDHVAGDDAADQEVFRHRDVRGARLLELAHVARGDALVLLDDDVAVLVGDVEARDFALQALGHELHLRAGVHQAEGVVLEEVRQDRFRIQADGLQQDRDGHLAATVDAEVQDVLRVELEVEPGAAVRNDPRREQQLAGRVGLALVVFEEHAGGAVQLADDDTLGAIDDERAVVGHERNFAHVDLLLLDLLDDLGRRGLAVIDDHLQLRAHGGGERESALLAFPHVERRFCDVELDELHLDHAVVRHDRERGQERRLQALGLALLRSDVLLKESHVGILLHRQQVRDVQNALALSEILPDPLAFSKAIGGCLRHTHSVSTTRSLAGEAHLVRRLATRDIASSCLVIGHYQSLADNPGIAPESDQTCSLQSDQRTLQSQLMSWLCAVLPEGIRALHMGAASRPASARSGARAACAAQTTQIT